MLWGTQGSLLLVPQSVAHLICVPQVPQMWYKLWHNFYYFFWFHFLDLEFFRGPTPFNSGSKMYIELCHILCHICGTCGTHIKCATLCGTLGSFDEESCLYPITGIGKIGCMNQFEPVKPVLMLGEYEKGINSLQYIKPSVCHLHHR